MPPFSFQISLVRVTTEVSSFCEYLPLYIYFWYLNPEGCSKSQLDAEDKSREVEQLKDEIVSLKKELGLNGTCPSYLKIFSGSSDCSRYIKPRKTQI